MGDVGFKTRCGEPGIPLKGEKSDDISDEMRSEDDESQGHRVGMNFHLLT